MPVPAILVLADGTVFRGNSIGAETCASGEVVFNTAMTGYQEILTDPSYARQLVTLTCPHIGNTGVNLEDEESDGIRAQGLIIRDEPVLASNWRSEQTLRSYLTGRGVPGIADIDTRKLTRILREQGAQGGCLLAGPEAGTEAGLARARAEARGFPGLSGMDLAQEVTCAAQHDWDSGSWSLASGYANAPEQRHWNVVAYDFGYKRNILRMLVDRNCRLTVVPARTPADQVLAMKPDGIFLSNGPGDPEPCDYAIEAIGAFLDAGVPLFGICLGHQLLALACGAKSMKMKFGHHGANHPVQCLADGRVMITSQNHGFAVDEASLPENVQATHRSLFDGSLQGIRRSDRPAFGFQGHPEASPGPHDAAGLFDQFIADMQARRDGGAA